MSRSICPNCGEKLDAYTEVTAADAIPGDGDMGFCLYCLYVHTFNADGSVKKATAWQLNLFASNPQAQKTMVMAKQMKEERDDATTVTGDRG
jgi:hypothetical protein